MNIENKPMTKSVDNLLLVNKPLFFSSSYLCSLLKKKLKGRFGRNVKVGHSGTLDPLASGLMIICTGKKTKILASVQGLDKEYVATIKVGATTPCYDGELAENRFYSTAHLTHSFIEKTINSFDIKRISVWVSCCRNHRGCNGCGRSSSYCSYKSRFSSCRCRQGR